MEMLYKKFVQETFSATGELEKINFNLPDNFNFAFDVVDEIAKHRPDNVAMIWCNDKGEEHTFTFKDIKEKSDKAAAYFKSLGIKKGDFVMLILKRHYQFWFAVMGLCKIGAIAIPATNQLMVKDLVYRINSADICAVICTADGEISENVDEAQKQCTTLKYKMMVNGQKNGWDNFDEGIEKFNSFDRPTGDLANKTTDMMLLYFTSGTTGMPKMVAHNFGYPIAHYTTARHWHNVRYQKPHLTVSETGWAKSVWGKLYGQWIMESIVFVYDHDRFQAADLLSKIEKYKVVTFCAPPTIYRFLLIEDLSKYDLSSLEYATVAGEPFNPETSDAFFRATGIRVKEGFGQTETTLSIATLTNDEAKPSSMGKPSPAYDIDIVDDEGNSVTPGIVGEIVLRTDKAVPYGMFMGYYKDQQRTDSVWYDNIYHTGDMAWQDEDGYVFYMSRKDDVIKSSGYRIGPFEVESVIMEHKAVLECAVTGVPDPVRGQAIKATIVLKAGFVGDETLKKEIQDYVKHTTAPYKYPRVVEFVESLPKTISGKVRRIDIRGN